MFLGLPGGGLDSLTGRAGLGLGWAGGGLGWGLAGLDGERWAGIGLAKLGWDGMSGLSCLGSGGRAGWAGWAGWAERVGRVDSLVGRAGLAGLGRSWTYLVIPIAANVFGENLRPVYQFSFKLLVRIAKRTASALSFPPCRGGVLCSSFSSKRDCKVWSGFFEDLLVWISLANSPHARLTQRMPDPSVNIWLVGIA